MITSTVIDRLKSVNLKLNPAKCMFVQKEVEYPMFGVPEALLSDRGSNLLSHLMLDICRLRS